jgi:hypothetical protein
MGRRCAMDFVAGLVVGIVVGWIAAIVVAAVLTYRDGMRAHEE